MLETLDFVLKKDQKRFGLQSRLAQILFIYSSRLPRNIRLMVERRLLNLCLRCLVHLLGELDLLILILNEFFS